MTENREALPRQGRRCVTLRVFYFNDAGDEATTMSMQEALHDALLTHVLGEGETFEIVSDEAAPDA